MPKLPFPPASICYMFVAVILLFLPGASRAASAQLPPVYAHHPISTNDPVSQALFDRGLTLYYAYNGSEGVHAFQALERREPKLAMAYWGEALSLSSDINQRLSQANFQSAHTAIEKAATLEEDANPSERAYIEAMRVRYSGTWEEHEKAEAAYLDAMGSAVANFPQDDDLASLYVEALLEKHTPTDTTLMVATLDRIIGRNPAHIMANHLVIHVFDDATDSSRSLLSAARLDAMNFAPEDEHLAHMPAHTYIHVGEYAKAVAASRRAIALFDQYLASPGVHAGHAFYLGHDLRVGFDASLMLGNYAQTQWFVGRQEERSHSLFWSALAAARFEHWADIARMVPTDGADPRHLAIAYWRLHQGDTNAAKAELSDALASKIPSDEHNSVVAQTNYLLYALRAATDVLQGNNADAIMNSKKAHAMERDANDGGEEIPFFPTDEIMGGAYFRVGKYTMAQRAYRSALDNYPNDARALYGLSQAFLKEGNATDARLTAKQFATVWDGSDTTLSPASL